MLDDIEEGLLCVFHALLLVVAINDIVDKAPRLAPRVCKTTTHRQHTERDTYVT